MRASRHHLLLPVLLALCLTSACLATADDSQSLNAFIPAAHKIVFDKFNVAVFGDLSVAKAAFRGTLAVHGKADLADFDIAASRTCSNDARALVSSGRVVARMGAVRNGYLVVGARSNLHHTVQTPCSNRVERFDPRRNGDPDLVQLRSDVIRESADLCVTSTGGTTETANDTMRFTPDDKGFSCYTFFKVHVDDLRLVRTWEYTGKDYYRNIVIVVTGLRADFRDLRMSGFNPRRTLIVFCAVYGSFGFYNARVHASILGPASSFTAMDSIFNGSLIVGGLRGSLATIDTPYVTC